MTGVCNNDANSCRAFTNGGLRCTNPQRYGVVCDRHARMMCGAAGNSFRYQKLMGTNFREITEEEAGLAVKAYLDSGGLPDRPRRSVAFADAVLEKLVADGGWVPIDVIAGWLSVWCRREVNTRETGMALRPLSTTGRIERRYHSTTQETQWRAVTRLS